MKSFANFTSWTLSDPPSISWVQILVGLLLLCCGQKLFWVFVGALGFLIGGQIAAQAARNQPELQVLLIALGLGILGGLLAIVLQRVAVAITACIGGGYLALRFALAAGWREDWILWSAIIVGALAAAILVSVLFDWALIVISAAIGALVISDALALSQSWKLFVGTILCALGIMTQVRRFKGAPTHPSSRESTHNLR